MTPKNDKKHQLSLFSLIMMAVISVDSLRNIPISAQFGFSLVSFYLLAGLFFFFPLAWVTAKLTSQYRFGGGSYIWIREAFGHGMGHFSLCLQWLYNMIWYPTIFAFITATFAAVIAPNLEQNKGFVLTSSLCLFWILTFIHSRGLRFSSWVNIASALLGTLIPMLVIIGLGVYWLLSGHPSATPFTWSSILPSGYDLKNIGFFSNILFSVLGLEVIAVYVNLVAKPKDTYPRALAISAVLIVLTLMLSSLALCIIMPVKKIALISGLMDILNVFFATFHIHHISSLIGLCVMIGGLGIASSWMLGLAKSLHISLSAMNSPKWLQNLNRHQVPTGILIFQALVYTLLLSSFLFFPNINQSYWILSAATAQFALLYYIILFCAAMKLLRTRMIPLLGVVICVGGFIAGFIPPNLASS